MRASHFLLALLACTSLRVHAGSEFYSIADVMASPQVVAILNPNVKLFWSNQALPALSVRSEASTYEQGISKRTPSYTLEDQCFEAFAGALADVFADAKLREYDAVVNLHSNYDGKPTSDPSKFECAGYGRRYVQLNAAFALTDEAARLAERARTDPSVVLPYTFKRTVAPRAKVLFLPLATVMNSAQVKAAQGSLLLQTGKDMPAGYVVPEVPEDFTRKTDNGPAGNEAGCYDAATRAVLGMIDDAHAYGYPAVMRIRSFLHEQPAPEASDFECEPGLFTNTVTLLGSFAKLK
ncbi:MAG TPA: hypothetical protein VLC92_07870 [Rhodocyclaceae bacterium]|nr:hypothetical protein [Rhodocyclaceae bacterium]